MPTAAPMTEAPSTMGRIIGQPSHAPSAASSLIKLLAALGAWLGWPMILPIVLGASVIGAAVGIVMKLTGALREGRYVPFGPFLAGAGVVVMLAGSQRVLDWLGWS